MKTYKINKGFIIQKLGKKTVIFDPEKSVLYTFNETASFIFQLLKKSMNIEAIADNLIKKYQIKKEIALRDVRGVIENLFKKKIII